MTFHGTIKSRCTRMIKACAIPNIVGGVLLNGMPFGLKNASATYQHAMSIIFHVHLGKKCNAMFTTSLLNVATRTTTFMTWEQCSTSYRLINWKWTWL